MTERRDNIRDLHRREQEAIAAVSNLEKRLDATSLNLSSSKKNGKLFQKSDTACGLPALSTNSEQSLQAVAITEQTALFPNLHVRSEIHMPALHQAEIDDNKKEDETIDTSTRSLSGNPNLPSNKPTILEDYTAKDSECLEQLELLKHETQMLLTSIRQIQELCLRGSMSAGKAGCAFKSHYERFSQKADAAMKTRWMRQTRSFQSLQKTRGTQTTKNIHLNTPTSNQDSDNFNPNWKLVNQQSAEAPRPLSIPASQPHADNNDVPRFDFAHPQQALSSKASMSPILLYRYIYTV